MPHYLFSQEGELKAHIMYGENWTYVVAVEDSWTMLMDFAQRMGMDNFFIPAGYSPQDAPAGLMVYIGPEYETQEDFIQDDLAHFLEANPIFEAEIWDQKVENEKENAVQLYRISSSETTVEQYIAYISGQGFHFAVALQLFVPNQDYLEDFITTAANSYVFPVRLNFE
jgi:hypothetical protein